MKKSDVAMLVLIASMSIMFSYFIAKATPLGSAATKSVKVPTIDKIETSLVDPDPRIFNDQAINPSVEVQIQPQGADQAPEGQ